MRELFIDLLSKQPLYNKGVQGTKINIHIPIRGKANEFCLEINNAVKRMTNSQIDFSANSFHVPHITLYMGYVNSKSEFDILMQRIQDFSKSIKSNVLHLSNVYLKKPKENYLFIDVEESEQIIYLKKRMKETCDNLIEPLSWDVVMEPPHITLAYIEDSFESVKENVIHSFQEKIELQFDAIEVSYCGAYGTCLGVIRAFELQ